MAFPHALHDMQQKQQQERSWTEQIDSFFSQPELYGLATSRGGGGEGGLVQVGNLFLQWIHFSIETSFLVEFDVYLFTARVKAR